MIPPFFWSLFTAVMLLSFHVGFSFCWMLWQPGLLPKVQFAVAVGCWGVMTWRFVSLVKRRWFGGHYG